jgi:ankyrin repeat protein
MDNINNYNPITCIYCDYPLYDISNINTHLDHFCTEKSGIDINKLFIKYIKECDNEDILKNFIHYDININFIDHHGYTPIHYSIINDRFELFKTLLENDADVDIKDKKYGNTPLHWILKIFTYSYSKLLLYTNQILQYNPKIDIRNNKRHTIMNYHFCNAFQLEKIRFVIKNHFHLKNIKQHNRESSSISSSHEEIEEKQ